MNPAANRGIRKGVRTLLQTVAGGGLTALVTVISGGLSPSYQTILMALFTAAVALAQNYLETAGKIPTILPTPAVVLGPTADIAVGTVTAGADTAGAVTGSVLDTAGDVVGEVTGTVGKLVGGVRKTIRRTTKKETK